MKLRTRLFLSLALLFTLIFFSSFFIEDHLVNRNFIKNEETLKTQVDALNQKKIKQIEDFISDVLNKHVFQTNALLSVIANTPILRYNFDFSSSNSDSKTWLDSATLITNNKWIDLVQNIKNNVISSTIFLTDRPCQPQSLKKAGERLYVVQLDDNKIVYAVKWDFPALVSSSGLPKDLHLPKEDLSDFYILFEKSALEEIQLDRIQTKDLVLSINPWYPFLKWIEVDEPVTIFRPFFDELNLAKQELNKSKLNQATLVFDKKNNPIYNTDVLTNRYDQIGMVWGLSTLIALGPFGKHPFDSYAPIGVIRTPKGSLEGEMLLSHEVFRADSPVVSHTEYSNKPLEAAPQLLFFEEDKKNCAFGNTLYMFDGSNKSQLSIGVRAEKVFKEIALGINRDLFFVANQEIIKVMSAQGENKEQIKISSEDLSKFLSQNSGELNIENQEYVFLRIQPFTDRDYHFFVINSKIEEFRLLDEISKEARLIIKKVNNQMILITLIGLCLALIILDFIAAKIVKPVAYLAMAAKKVEEGDLAHVDLSAVQSTRKDEIGELALAFHDMVQGLKEKEKVRSILNKVVSKEIASEILKKDLNLGGEEKVVTVLFADIRHFTKMTEQMTPTQVVSLVNGCMTLVTEIVEKYQGVIDKYVGDEVMALFGAPLDLDQNAFCAVSSAFDVIKSLDQWNKKRIEEGLLPVQMGIGIHTGKVLAGNMGSVDRANYTVLGSNVNLASRICSTAKESEILVSEAVAFDQKVNLHFILEPLEPMVVKGFSEKIKMYRIVERKRT